MNKPKSSELEIATSLSLFIYCGKMCLMPDTVLIIYHSMRQ